MYRELRFINIQHKHFSKNLHFSENLQDLKSYFKIAFIKSFKNFTLTKDIYETITKYVFFGFRFKKIVLLNILDRWKNSQNVKKPELLRITFCLNKSDFYEAL